jgi:MFS family permease
MQPVRDNARILTASLVGTAVEYYDFFIYGTAASLFFGPLFFPHQSHAAQTMLALMTFGIAFYARPIGAIAFGHFGDRIGRKSTLVASLLLMGGSTFAIAFLPSYALVNRWGVGWVAPLLLCLLRFGQGFGLGGEWAGAALLSVENAPRGWESRFGSTPPMGSNLGLLLATLTFLLLQFALSDADMASWGWRLPFLASAVLVGLGLWIRLRIGETPAFRAAAERAPPPRLPFIALVSERAGAVLAGSLAATANFSIFYMLTAFALTQSKQLGYPQAPFLAIQMATAAFTILGIALGGYLADRTSPRRILATGVLLMVPVGLVFGKGLGSGSLALVSVMLCGGGIVAGIGLAPLGRWLSQLFPVRVRYSGVAFAFNLGGILGGAVMPLIAQMMSTSGHLDLVGGLLVATGLMAFVAVSLVRPVAEDAVAPGIATAP